jgi:LytR cell envelope-related transcriptional attenuator
VTERAAPVVALLALAVVATGTVFGLDVMWGSDDLTPGPRTETLLVVRSDEGPFVAVVASGGGRRGAVVTIPPDLALTVPGHGDSTVADVVMLPGDLAATAISNALGAWVAHYGVLNAGGLAGVVDRLGGLHVSGERLDGVGVLETLASPERQVVWGDVVRALASSDQDWRAEDFADVDDARAVARALAAAADPQVAALPMAQIPGGALVVAEGPTADLVARVFGGDAVLPVPLVVLNGSGEPGVGASVAEVLIPAGFRIVVSGNAARFVHAETLVVASTPDDRPAAERAQAALGVGTVSVSGAPTGVADVTIVVGEDFDE